MDFQKYKKISTGTSTYGFNLLSVLASESYRRLYPIVRDKNTLTLTDGTNTSTITSTSITATSLKSTTTTVIVSNATAPSSGQVLTATSSTNAIWETMTAPTQSYLKFNKIVFINTSSYLGTSDSTIVGQQDYIIVNVTDAPVNSTINLPTLSGNGTYHFLYSKYWELKVC